MPSRRTLLTATASLAATAGLAGCSTTFGDDPERHYVDMLNGSEQSHVFAVTVTDEAGETIFEREYDLGPRKGDENRVVDGVPAQVTVVVDGDDRHAFPWAPRESAGFAGSYPDGCSAATTTSLTIWYGLQSGAEIEPTYGCETVRDSG